MVTILAIIFMGWPAILGSLMVSAAGVVRRRPALLVTGAVLCLGFAWYLGAWPMPVFKALGYSLPLLHLAGALAVHYRHRWLPWLLLAPHGMIAVYLAIAVLASSACASPSNF